MALRLLGKQLACSKFVNPQWPSSAKYLRASASTFTMKPAQTVTVRSETFEEKNARLQRPLSPHLSIYKFQMNMSLSISHRITGLALSAATIGVAVGALTLPGSFPYYLGLLSSVHFGPAIIFGAKFLLSFPLTYHTINGVRHLVWDAGKGFTLKSIQQTGYAVLASSILGALLLASM